MALGMVFGSSRIHPFPHIPQQLGRFLIDGRYFEQQEITGGNGLLLIGLTADQHRLPVDRERKLEQHLLLVGPFGDKSDVLNLRARRQE